jgi:hypothetical protein
MSPRTVEKDRPIDPMSGKKFARKCPNRFRAFFDSGRAPALHAASVSQTPAFLMLPFRFARAMRERPLSVVRIERALHPAMDNNDMSYILCKEIAVMAAMMVNRKDAPGACRAGGQGTPLPLKPTIGARPSAGELESTLRRPSRLAYERAGTARKRSSAQGPRLLDSRR